ncbi:MAG: arylsulfatase [Acidobacteria bacterium]|nr:arylsulfatase [Acidobacteriota bacterium]
MIGTSGTSTGEAVAALLLVGALGACTSGPPAEPEPAPPPNIVYVLADDLGYGEVGVYGQEIIETPNIDALARGGMRFTDHYSGSPVCAPSRGVIMTGLHTGHAWIRGNDEMGDRGDVWDFAKMAADPNLEGQRPLPAGTRTLGRLLQEAGYATGFVGKWGLGGPLTEGIPNEQGFDFFFGYNCQRQAHTYFPVHLWKNREKVPLDNEMVPPNTPLQEGADPNDPQSYSRYWLTEYAPDLMLEEALRFIQQNRDRPFFLDFASPIPHVPLQAPERWVKHYQEKLGPEEPYTGTSYFPNRTPRATYAAMVSTLDEQVGRILEKLDELGLRERTLVVFTSDNGPTYAGGADSAFFDSARPFRSDSGRGKGSVYEGGIRVPMIASWPGRIAPGTTTDHVSAFWDVLPTLCEIGGGTVPDDIDGISFAPVLLGKAEGQSRHEFLYWEFPSYGGQQAVRLGKWKGVRRNMFDGNMTVELYDLESDREEDDVSAEHPEIVARIEAIMEREHTPSEIERFRFGVLGEK